MELHLDWLLLASCMIAVQLSIHVESLLYDLLYDLYDLHPKLILIFSLLQSRFNHVVKIEKMTNIQGEDGVR